MKGQCHFLQESHILLMLILHNIHTRAQNPETLLKYLSTGLGALSTRISIILTKSFHIIIHTCMSSLVVVVATGFLLLFFGGNLGATVGDVVVVVVFTGVAKVGCYCCCCWNSK